MICCKYMLTSDASFFCFVSRVLPGTRVFVLQSDPCHGVAGARSRAQQKLRDIDELGIDVELFAVHAPPPAPHFNMVRFVSGVSIKMGIG